MINDANNADSDFEASGEKVKTRNNGNAKEDGGAGKAKKEAANDSKVEEAEGVPPTTTGRRKALVTYPNGDMYEGMLMGQLRDGEGMYTTPKGDVYVGGYKMGRRHGKGVYTMKDGTRYEGDFRDGMK